MRQSRNIARASNVEGQLEVTHSGDTFKVLVRKVHAARRFTLRVRAATGDVVLSIPARSRTEEALPFVERNAAWIGARLRRLPEPVPFRDGASIPLRGVEHRIVHAPHARGTVWAEHPPAPSPVTPPSLFVAGGQAHIERRISDFLKKEARTDLTQAVRTHAGKLGLTPAKILLRDTISRWGSCSSSGALSFSWRLVLAPAFVLDYLAAHEVAHLRHMNHSPRFWRLVRDLCADTDRAEAWLSAHGPSLHRYGQSRKLP